MDWRGFRNSGLWRISGGKPIQSFIRHIDSGG